MGPWRPKECPDCAARTTAAEAEQREAAMEAERVVIRAQWRRATGMPETLLTKRFENFDAGRQKEAFRVAQEWADGFDIDKPRGYRSLIFYSAVPGVGKGHLMCAIVNRVIENWRGTEKHFQAPIRFESGPSLVRRIRATYNIRTDDNFHEREDEVYRALAGVPLLLLDDVGKEKPSTSTQETYWYLIDERVKNHMPVIISSRKVLEGEDSLEPLMGVDTVDRLFGMTGGVVVSMRGISYRRENKVA